MFRVCLLSLAVCMDNFFASAGCSMSGIFIPKRCALLISAVGTGFLGISLCGAEVLKAILPEMVVRYGSFGILLLLGSSQFLKEMLTAFFRKHRPHWNWKALGLVIDICFDETLADTDHSKILSMREAVAYATALSLDSLASGLGAGILRSQMLSCLCLTFVSGYFLNVAGNKFGRKFQNRKNFSWVGGALLLVLAFCRL